MLCILKNTFVVLNEFTDDFHDKNLFLLYCTVLEIYINQKNTVVAMIILEIVQNYAATITSNIFI